MSGKDDVNDGIRIHVLCFAVTREIVGGERTTLTLPDGSRAGAALAALCRTHPGLESVRGTLRLAVNESYADPGTALADGDVLALIPPVSGG
jgi:molybdopterin converting factor subunit 1